MSSSTGNLGIRDFRVFALREHYLYFKLLAYGVSPLLCVVFNALGITPNQVTLTGIALVVPAVIFNLTGHVWVGIILFHLFFVFDATDGILARATGRKSKLGAYLDDMAHHMFHVPFLLSMAYSEYTADRQLLAALIAFFAIANTLYRAQLDVLEKSGLLESRQEQRANATPHGGAVRWMRDVVLGSFNFPNVLVWMTVLLWSPRLMTAYFIYASATTALYYIYTFLRALRCG